MNTQPTESRNLCDEPSTDRPVMDPEAAKLLREVMSLKAKLKDRDASLARFNGINPEKVQDLTARAATAEKARQDAEIEKLRASGDWEAYKARLVADHRATVEEAHMQLAAQCAERETLTRQIQELTVGNAFTASAFIKEKLVLPVAKARKLYEAHFDAEGDQVVAYDAPRGHGERSPLINQFGEPMTFEAAIQRLVDADPDRDALLRASRRDDPATEPALSNGNRHIGAGIDRMEAAIDAGALPRTASAVARASARWQSQPSATPQGVSSHDLGVDRIAKGLSARANQR